jgi:tetratricopeptide (TPR) repeat protein
MKVQFKTQSLVSLVSLKSLVSLFVVALLFAACDDFLSTPPDNRAEVDTPEEIAKLLVSAYPDISHCAITEMASDNVDEIAGKSWTADLLQQEAFYWEPISTESLDGTSVLWEAHYAAIAAANKAIAAIDELGNPSELNPQLGEALLCRAYAHFVLVNVFCQHYTATHGNTDLGIPYMTTLETSVAPRYQRGTVSEVYEKIDADIEQALPLIDDDIYTIIKYHFNRRAAYAFAARFNLYYARWSKAVDYASQALTDNPALALRDWVTGGYISPSSENHLRADWYVSVENRANLLVIAANSLWGRVHGPAVGYERYAHNDLIAYYETCKAPAPWNASGASQLNYSIPQYLNTTKVIMLKLAEYFKFSDVVSGIGSPYILHPVFTTDEALLCRAEAYTMLQDYDKAMADMRMFQAAFTVSNTLTREHIIWWGSGEMWKQERPEIYYTPFAPTPIKRLNPDFGIVSPEQEYFLQSALYMRRVLTLHEGLRWFDLKRYGIEIYHRSIEITAQLNGATDVKHIVDMLQTRDPRYALQLPAAVISAGLEPNPR